MTTSRINEVLGQEVYFFGRRTIVKVKTDQITFYYVDLTFYLDESGRECIEGVKCHTVKRLLEEFPESEFDNANEKYKFFDLRTLRNQEDDFVSIRLETKDNVHT